jgi:hypothetical protein
MRIPSIPRETEMDGNPMLFVLTMDMDLRDTGVMKDGTAVGKSEMNPDIPQGHHNTVRLAKPESTISPKRYYTRKHVQD